MSSRDPEAFVGVQTFIAQEGFPVPSVRGPNGGPAKRFWNRICGNCAQRAGNKSFAAKLGLRV